jgi:membrane-associated protease RseP (regulator of RpoE activity)
MANFSAGNPPLVEDGDLFPMLWAFQHPQRMLTGWEFSLTLLGILLAHELGHYFACRAHGIRASLPYVLPAPTLSGTAGAVIRIQSRIPNRIALMDVGIAGPIAGFIFAVPAILVGLLLSKPIEAGSAPPLVKFGEPLTIRVLDTLLRFAHPGLPAFGHMVMHPVLVAGWVGLFITSLNLIPAGQLDGGHIVYSISPRLHRISTYSVIGMLLILGASLWLGWLLWGAFLLLPMMQHPKVPLEPKLNKRRWILGAVALVILILTLLPSPLRIVH